MSNGVLIAGIIVAVLVYLWIVVRFPRMRCRKCQSFSGRHHTFPTSSTFRKCRRCKGTGWHVRPMRRVLPGGNYDASGVWQGP